MVVEISPEGSFGTVCGAKNESTHLLYGSVVIWLAGNVTVESPIHDWLDKQKLIIIYCITVCMIGTYLFPHTVLAL